MRMYMSVKQAAKKWGISDRQVKTLCTEGKTPGAFQGGTNRQPVEALAGPTSQR